MRLRLYKSGLIDDLIIQDAELLITRLGVSKYLCSLKNQAHHIEFELWTTQKGVIHFEIRDDKLPDWVVMQQTGCGLDGFSVAAASIHIEHCDRGLYYLHLLKENDSCLFSIASPGYLKTQVVKHDIKSKT